MKYDLIIAGAGLGGLSLVHHYLKRADLHWRILMIDQDAKKANDRTWSFWSDQPVGYTCSESNIWDHLGFCSERFQKFDDIRPYQYHTIRGIDFYEEVFAEIQNHPNIDFHHAEILTISETESGVDVRTANCVFHGAHVVDSVTRPTRDVAYLWNSQNFLGWDIKVAGAVFDRQRPILMDFRVPQTDAASFVYFLPYSESEALVEYTEFARSQDFDKLLFERKLRDYIQDVLGLQSYQVIEEERGAIPMTNYPFERRSGRVFRIGTVGGDTKPTTGYTFVNVQRHANQVIDELLGRTVQGKKIGRFGFYDNLLLQIINENPQQVKPIMEKLFHSQSMHRVLKFLHEDTTLTEEVAIFSRLPWHPFLSVLKDQAISRLSDASRAMTPRPTC